MRSRILAVAALAVVLAGCSSTSTTLPTLPAPSTAASTSAGASVLAIGQPAAARWASGSTGTITVKSAKWEDGPDATGSAPSRGARLILDVTLAASTGTATVDPYGWIVTQADGQTITAGLETAMRKGGMQALPIAAGKSQSGLIVFDVAHVLPVTVTLSEKMATPITWAIR